MKKIIALLLAIITIFSLAACNLTGSQENAQVDNSQSKNDNKPQDDNQQQDVQDGTSNTDNESKWDIIYNLDDLTDEWWNSPHETFSSNTNKELLNYCASSSIGYLDGALSVGTLDLEIPVYTSTSTHIMKLENNKFIIPREINRLDNREYGNENLLDCIVLTKSFESCLIRIDFDAISFLRDDLNVDVKDGEWVVSERKQEDGEIYYDCTYGLDQDFCLQINTMDDYMIDDENRKHLLEELCKSIKIEDFEDDGQSYVKLNHQVQIADDVQFVTDNRNIVKWHSGYDGHNAFSSAVSGSRMDLINNNNQEVVLKEFAPGIIVPDKYYSNNGYMLEKHDYNGHELVLIRDDPEQMPWASDNRINGFYFCVNDAVYEFVINKDVEEPEDIHAWITSAIDGILVFD